MKGHTGSVTAMSTDPDGKKLYTVSADSTVRYWDIRSGKALLFFEAHGGPIIAMCVNHRLMYTASTDGTGKYYISKLHFSLCSIYVRKRFTTYLPNAFFILTRKLVLRPFFMSKMSQKKLQKDLNNKCNLEAKSPGYWEIKLPLEGLTKCKQNLKK